LFYSNVPHRIVGVWLVLRLAAAPCMESRALKTMERVCQLLRQPARALFDFIVRAQFFLGGKLALADVVRGGKRAITL
jgi:hypothetical protein